MGAPSSPLPWLCLATPNGYFLPMETFIRHQVDGLAPGLTLVGGHYPMWAPNRTALFPAYLAATLPRGLLRRGLPPLFRALYQRHLHHLWRTHGTRVLLCQYGPMAVHLLPMAKAAQMPLVVHFHGYDASIHRVLQHYAAGYRAMFHYARAVIAVSKPMAETLHRAGAPADRLHVLPYGVDLTQFQGAQPAATGKRLLFVGRLVPKKDPLTLLEAFRQVRRLHPDAHLDIAGQGPLLPEVQQFLAQHDLGAAVTLHGHQPPARVAQLMQQASVYVQHSRRGPDGDSEGTPNSILEASATGLPVVSTRHAGIPEAVVQGVTGLLVDEGDAAGMAQHLNTLLADPALAARLGAAARAHMHQHYDRVQHLQRLAALLQPA